jgi:hypothetical protein
MISRMISVFLSLISMTTYGRAIEDNMAICYIVKGDEIKSKSPCVASNGGGAGMSILTYTFNGKEYLIEESDAGDFLNGKKFTSYMRDDFFKITSEEDKMNFYCYRTKDKSIDFCSLQKKVKE